MPRGDPRLRAGDGRQNLAGRNVKARRAGLKLTQDALCARLAAATGGRWNPSPGDIRRIESGTRIISDLELVALAGALECAPADLLAPPGPAA